jgi:hypothetical protein
MRTRKATRRLFIDRRRIGKRARGGFAGRPFY